MIFLTVLSIMLMLFFSTLLIVLIIPVTYCIRGSKNESITFEARVRWLFGCLNFLFQYDNCNGVTQYASLFGKSINFNTRDKQEKNEVKRSRVKLTYFLDKNLVASILQLVRKLLKSLKPRIFQINGKIGLDDPYYTAIVNSIIYSLNISGLYIESVFDDEVIEGELLIEGRWINGIAIIWFIEFLLSKPVINILKKMLYKNKGEIKYVSQ